MNATDLSQLSISELKSMCAANSLEVRGDRRSKSTWVLAVTQWQIEVAPAVDVPDYQPIESPFELVIKSELIERVSESLPVATTQQQQALNQKHSPSIVMLAPLILLSVAVIAIRIGISALIPTIAAVGRLLVSIWGFSNREDVPTRRVLISSAQS